MEAANRGASLVEGARNMGVRFYDHHVSYSTKCLHDVI